MNVQLLIPVHNINTVHKLILFQKCLFYLDSFDLDRHAFIDKTVTENIIELLVHHRFTIHSNCPLPEWEKVKYAYDLLEGPYIAICHQDDFWLEKKLDLQLKYINNVPIVVSSYLLNKDHFENKECCLRVCVLHHDEQYGLVDCMPSTWLLNKTLLPTLPIPFFARYCSDLACLLAIGQVGPIEIIRTPLVFYNEHLENQGTTIPRSEVEAGRQQLRNYAKTVKRPVLNYHWS